MFRTYLSHCHGPYHLQDSRKYGLEVGRRDLAQNAQEPLRADRPPPGALEAGECEACLLSSPSLH